MDAFTQVRDACDIVDIISEHIALKRAGKEFKGLCPFHEDRRPSMAVVPQKQIFHCFVCNTGGDVIKFISLYHKMGVGEALRFLAQKKGIRLPDRPGFDAARQKEQTSVKEQIADANAKACGFFERTLRTELGCEGLAYLRNRGLTEETISKFRLGMAPDNWTGLVTTAGKLGIDARMLVTAALVKQRNDGSVYDLFRNRVMFPIIDTTNRVIAFGGRVMVEKRDEAGDIVEAKYVNSPETELFKKHGTLYGMNLARGEISKTSTAVVVEGYMDVIACHQVGITNVVATLGTALTPDHAKVLKRFCDTVILIFDSDEAGRRATDRAMELFVNTQLDIRLASVPAGKDPCDYCMSAGGEAMRKVIAGAVDAMDFQWRRVAAQLHDTKGVQARQALINKFVDFVGAAMAGATIDTVKRVMLTDKVASLVGLDRKQVALMLRRKQDAAREATQKSPPTASAEIDSALSTQDSALPLPPPRRMLDIRKLTGLPRTESTILGCLLIEPVLYERVRDAISADLFDEQTFRPLAVALFEYLENSGDLAQCSVSEFVGLAEDGWVSGQAAAIAGNMESVINRDGISAQHQKMIQQFQEEAGRTMEELLITSLHYLREKRAGDGSLGNDPADESLSEEERQLRDLQAKTKARDTRGGNQRGFGLDRG